MTIENQANDDYTRRYPMNISKLVMMCLLADAESGDLWNETKSWWLQCWKSKYNMTYDFH